MCSYIESDATILDVGCACGDMGAALKGSRTCALFGMEYDGDSIKSALAKKAYEKIDKVDLNNFETSLFTEYNNYISVYNVCVEAFYSGAYGCYTLRSNMSFLNELVSLTFAVGFVKASLPFVTLRFPPIA